MFLNPSSKAFRINFRKSLKAKSLFCSKDVLSNASLEKEAPKETLPHNLSFIKPFQKLRNYHNTNLAPPNSCENGGKEPDRGKIFPPHKRKHRSRTLTRSFLFSEGKEGKESGVETGVMGREVNWVECSDECTTSATL
ncbi:hypothetical protein TNCT_190671 [Trichonephila clavata]|uniref:Uncharacterized protein n=1 Tax=Trichonephila clavata TaxID=2740835 RepID=A0A8X6H027_TRICU|nr:hypothetical protein TNCT_190671 [Trichonephila clavata]